MSLDDVAAIDAKFQQLRSQLTTEQWVDSSYLVDRANELRIQDIALAFRIAQRARNLAPENQEIQEVFAELRREFNSAYPSAARTKSRTSSVRRASGKIKGLLTKAPEKTVEKWQAIPDRFRTPLFLTVVLPLFVFSFYQLIWASSRYESQSQVIVKQPDAASLVDPAMAFLTGMGVSSSGTDSLLVEKFVYSTDLLNYLDEQLALRSHYSDSSIDFFSRLHSWNSKEDFLNYYKKHVSVEVDSLSSIITIRTQAFSPEYSNALNEMIVKRAEWYINSVGHFMAKEQMAFMQKEHEVVEEKLHKAQSRLLNFQEQYNLLDPTAEGMARQEITYSIEGQLSIKQAELKALQLVMSDSAPEVLAAQREINALQEQLKIERNRLSPNKKIDVVTSGDERVTQLSVGEILASYSDLKVAMELALQAYTSSLVSLEKSRIEAYRQLQYLVTVESSTTPDDAKYPRVTYNIALFAVVLLMLFGIGSIIRATIKELG
ncbi:lipopolysaccharide biosynthesis protein [Neiella sp. HB171785]|uniref:Lipopolysaccharide biosynthesis protein n=1 Tax=Neiella litorisoli TaxID=2771431 RepID=A0A8J6QV17_9GAMM|nr:lipopolysaccharide biosynthesis protein [Neiella litorisoli]MBD1389818.1 lipopolysaccharide biosynthesis protein [Neiella litorisoli]